MEKIKNPLIEKDISSPDILILSYINEYFTRNEDQRENVLNYFIDMWENNATEIWRKLDNKKLFYFFCSYVIKFSGETPTIKNKVKNLVHYKLKQIANYTQHCIDVLTYIMTMELIVDSNLILEIYSRTQCVDKVSQYIDMLEKNENNILAYIKIDKNVPSRIETYTSEYFRNIYIKSPEYIKLYTYIQPHISEMKKIENIKRICEIEKENVFATNRADMIINILLQLKQIEKNQNVLELLNIKIEELSAFRANSIMSGEELKKMKKREYKMEIPQEYINHVKIITNDIANILLMGIIPSYKKVPVSNLLDFVSYSSIDEGTGLCVENFEDNREKKYFEENCSISISPHFLNSYKMICQGQLQMFVQACQINDDLKRYNKMILNFFEDCSDYELDEYFLLSMAGCLLVVNKIETQLKSIHSNHFAEKEDPFDMLVDLTEENYLYSHELFYINYVIFDKNGQNIRNNLAHGNLKFKKGNTTLFYSLFLILIIVSCCEQRKEFNER